MGDTMGDEWVVDKPKKMCNKCSHADDMDVHKIIFSRGLWHVIQAMCLKFPEHEWQMMLTGGVTKDGIFCDGYYVTKQKVSGALVTNLDAVTKEMIEEKHIVAGIHSHVNMGVTPSGTDINDSVMSLIDYHVIVNNRHELNGMRKEFLPCDGVTVVKCNVFVENEFKLSDIAIEGVDRIEKATYQTQTIVHSSSINRPFARAAHERDYDDEYDAEVIRHMQQHGHYGY